MRVEAARQAFDPNPWFSKLDKLLAQTQIYSEFVLDKMDQITAATPKAVEIKDEEKHVQEQKTGHDRKRKSNSKLQYHDVNVVPLEPTTGLGTLIDQHWSETVPLPATPDQRQLQCISRFGLHDFPARLAFADVGLELRGMDQNTMYHPGFYLSTMQVLIQEIRKSAQSAWPRHNFNMASIDQWLCLNFFILLLRSRVQVKKRRNKTES